MLVSFNWLKEFVNITRSPEEVADILTMAGLEVEGITKEADDTVLEVSLTPNRGDCLSITGIARELGAFTGKKVRYPRFVLPNEDNKAYIRVRIDNKDLCRRYTGRVIKGVKIGASPEWLRKRLEASGIRALNNVVDITNYVMLESGQPLHAFDFSKLKSKLIRAATPQKTIKFKTLDGVDRQITPEMLMIWDGETPVAVAGVMGGLESEIDDNTTTIFLESAFFDQFSVRKTSSKLGIRTESSFRFERGIDFLNVDKALGRASWLVSEIAGGVLCKKVDITPRKYVSRSVKLDYGLVNGLLGLQLSNAKIQDYLHKIGTQAEEFDNSLHVEVPSYRNDIEKDVDLVEEIARLYGYPKIPAVPPQAKIEANPLDHKRKKIGAVKEIFIQRGYSEAVNFSFMNPEMLDLLRIGEGDNRQKAVRILNPLRKEEALMRTTVIPSLIENFVHNFSRGERDIRLFEISNIFFAQQRTGSDKLPLQSLRVGGICLTEKLHQLWKIEADEFFAVKGDLEAMLQALGVEGSWERSSEPFLHPVKSADIRVNGKKAGFLGVLSPEIASTLEVKIFRSEAVLFEFDLDLLLSASGGINLYRKFSQFPYIQRDISILVDEGKSAHEIISVLKSYKTDLVEEIRAFDYYAGKNIPQGKVSLAFSITYRSFERTLSEEEVEKVHKDLVGLLVTNVGAELRS